MIVQEEKDELLAMARQLPTNVQVQLPDQANDPAPTYVRSAGSGTAANTDTAKVSDTNTAANASKSATDALNLKPIDTGVKTLQIAETANNTGAAPAGSITPLDLTKKPAADGEPAVEEAGVSSELVLPDALPELKRGEKARIAVAVKGSSLFRSAVLGLRFDDKRLAVRSVSLGEIFGAGASNTSVAPFINNNGKMFVSLSLPTGSVVTTSGVLAIVEVEALTDGKVELAFEKDVISFLAPDGRTIAMKY